MSLNFSFTITVSNWFELSTQNMHALHLKCILVIKIQNKVQSLTSVTALGMMN